MIREIRKKLSSQKGFTLVELMVVIAILGILAAIAVPRFSDSTTLANTAKVAADLRTIDSAIGMFLAANPGATPTAPSGSGSSANNGNLVGDYLAAWPTPPTGNVYIGSSSPSAVPTGGYVIVSNRAAIGTNNYHAEDFHK